MANFREVNRAIRARFPKLDIEVVRGEGCDYFSGDDGWEIESLYVYPPTTPTPDMIRMAIEHINDACA